MINKDGQNKVLPTKTLALKNHKNGWTKKKPHKETADTKLTKHGDSAVEKEDKKKQ